MFRFLIALCCLMTVAWADMPITVKVDGKIIKFPHGKPQAIGGRTMVPLRGVFEAIGAYVDWNPETRRVICRKENEEVELRVGERIAKKNGTEIEIDVAPRIVNGSTLVPLRFIAESLGAKVSYDRGNNIVEIATGEESTTLFERFVCPTLIRPAQIRD